MQRNLSLVQLPEARTSRPYNGGKATLVSSALVDLSGALALAWAGLWLVIASNIRTAIRYRVARRRPRPPEV